MAKGPITNMQPISATLTGALVGLKLNELSRAYTTQRWKQWISLQFRHMMIMASQINGVSNGYIKNYLILSSPIIQLIEN